MSLEGNQIVLLAPGYGALLLPVRNTCTCKHAHNLTMTSWLNSNMVVHTCICIAIQSGNLRALCIFIAKRGWKKKSHPPKTRIQRKRQWMCFTGILQVWERKQEKRSRTGPVRCWWDISKYFGSEPCRGNTVEHAQSSRDSKAFPSAWWWHTASAFLSQPNSESRQEHRQALHPHTHSAEDIYRERLMCI